MDDYLDNVTSKRRYERNKRKGYDKGKYAEKSFKDPSKRSTRIKINAKNLPSSDDDSENINMRLSNGRCYSERW